MAWKVLQAPAPRTCIPAYPLPRPSPPFATHAETRHRRVHCRAVVQALPSARGCLSPAHSCVHPLALTSDGLSPFLIPPGSLLS